MCVDESHRPALGSCAGADNSRRPEGSWGVGPAIPQVAPKAKALEEKTKAERRTTKKKTRAAGRSPSKSHARSAKKKQNDVDESHRPALGSCAGADNSRRPEGSWGVGPAIPQVAPKAKALDEKTKAERRRRKRKRQQRGAAQAATTPKAKKKKKKPLFT
jgi:hypothetical protein